MNEVLAYGFDAARRDFGDEYGSVWRITRTRDRRWFGELSPGLSPVAIEKVLAALKGAKLP